MRTQHSGIFGALSLIALLSAGPIRAEVEKFIVEDAVNLPFHAGDQVPGDQLVHLAAGQELSLIAPDGQAIVLRGPYVGRVVPQQRSQDSNLADMLMPLIEQAGAESATPGIIRSFRPAATTKTDNASAIVSPPGP